MKEWIKKNKILTFILFWGGIILIIYILSGLRKTDYRTPEELCSGQKNYQECLDKIERYYELQEE